MLADLAAVPARLAVLSDFDGSLSAVVEDPDAAMPVEGALDVLGRLIGPVGRVGVVSGRTVGFLRSRLPVPGLCLAGLHGSELWVDGEHSVDARVESFRPALAAATAEAAERLPGVRVEQKGGLGATLHWRACPERAAEIRGVAAAVAARHGLMVATGRMIVELRPPVSLDKGTAVDVLAAGHAAALFAGDDDGDLAGFDALDRGQVTGRIHRTVRVAVRSPETPAELLERADLVVDGPPAFVALLEDLARTTQLA